jgi:hypothetical protein
MGHDEQIESYEKRIAKLEADLDMVKTVQNSEMANYVRRQDDFSREFKILYNMVQGEGNNAGLFEEVRNLKKYVRLYGIVLSVLVSGSELGVFKAILHLIMGNQ